MAMLLNPDKPILNTSDDDDDVCDVSALYRRASKDSETVDDTQNVRVKRKKGIIYVTNIPKHMNVTRIREYLSPYGSINRVYLQPTTPLNERKRIKNTSFIPRHFSEGWIEFNSKRVARQVAEMLNNKQISLRKKSSFYDCYWSMRYLPHFKWHHLTERMRYEQTVLKQRGRIEVHQAQREAAFFQSNLDKSEWRLRHAKQHNSQDNKL